MSREYIAYQGIAFIIEWYYDSKGVSHALDYYNQLKQNERIKFLQLLKRMGDVGEIKDTTKFNYEGGQIYAFKPKPQRFLCFFFTGRKIILTNAFCKKQDKLPQNEKHKALKNKSDYESRLKTGEYYE